FEPRYVELVRDCTRDDRGFGVCAILEGSEVGEPPTHAALGCEARIVDFTTLPDGLLGITVLGGRRFHVSGARVRANGAIEADVPWLPAPPPTPLAIEHELLATLLRRCLEQLGGDHARAGDAEFGDADWVAWRLAELLPLATPERLELLGESDPHAR